MTNKQLEDIELIRSYKETSDLGILAVLYERYIDLVYGVCKKYYQQHEDAEDSVVAIYEELISKLLKHDVQYFKGWLYQLTCNHCLMTLRKRKKNPIKTELHDMQMGDNMHLEEQMEKEIKLNLLEKCMDHLQEKQKKAIVLFYIQEKCYAEIAAITGYELNMVRSFIQNGRRNLRLCMEENQIES